MTGSKIDNMTGEERLKNRRRKWWRYTMMVLIAMAALGFLTGRVASAYDAGALPLWVPIVAIVATALAVAWSCLDFFRRADEVDLIDNLWSHVIGMYGGFIVFIVWYPLADLGLISHPTGLWMLGIMLLITYIVYGARKLGLR